MDSSLRRHTLLFITVLICGCGAGDQTDPTVRADSAGVEIVRSPGADRPPPLTLTEQFRLGGDDTRPEESFHQVTSGNVGTDAAGNIHVLDSQARRVITFDSEGRHVRTVGRAGGGPGEFGMPFGLVVEPDGTIGVIDISKRGLVRFDPAGELLPVQPFPGGYRGGNLHAHGETVVAPVQVAMQGGGYADALIRASATDTTRLAEVPMPQLKPVEFSSCGMSFSGMAPIFSPGLRWAAHGDRVVTARSDVYDLLVTEISRMSDMPGLEQARIVRRIRRDIEPTPATTELAIEEQGEGMKVGTESGQRVCDAREVVEKLGTAPTLPVIAAIAVAPDGSIWVQRGDVRGRPRAIDVFAGDGEYRGTFEPGSPFPVAFLPDGRIAAPEKDEFDVTRLVVYRVQGGR